MEAPALAVTSRLCTLAALPSARATAGATIACKRGTCLTKLSKLYARVDLHVHTPTPDACMRLASARMTGINQLDSS